MYGGKLCVWHSFENEVFVQILLVHLGVGGGFVDEGNKMGAPKRLQVLPPPPPSPLTEGSCFECVTTDYLTWKGIIKCNRPGDNTDILTAVLYESTSLLTVCCYSPQGVKFMTSPTHRRYTVNWWNWLYDLDLTDWFTAISTSSTWLSAIVIKLQLLTSRKWCQFHIQMLSGD